MADNLQNLVADMDNMSLEDLGGSLLARQSKINAEREKQARKSQKITNALALIGIGQALTKDAFKKRTAELDNIEAFSGKNNDYQAEQWRIKANVINKLENQVDFDSPVTQEDYNKFKKEIIDTAQPGDMYYFGDNANEGDYRAAYLHDNNYLDIFTNEFADPIDKYLQVAWGTKDNYEKLVQDSETYNYLLDLGGLDVARHFLKNVSPDENTYRANYENFMDEALDLLTMNGFQEMDRAEALNIMMGLTPPKVDQLERDYFRRQRNLRDKGIFGGVADVFRKFKGISEKNGSPNVFDTISKQDIYGNRQKADGQFEINTAAVIQQSIQSAIANIKSGANSQAPIGKDSRARIAYESDEDLKTIIEGSADLGISGVLNPDGFFYESIYGTLSFAEQRNDYLANLAIPMYKGENVRRLGQNYKVRRGTKLKAYLDDLGPREFLEMNQQVGILAKEFELNKEFARDVFFQQVGTLTNINDPKRRADVNSYFESKYSTSDGRVQMAAAIVARNGLYSEGVKFREIYKKPDDIIDFFDSSLYPPAFNKNGGILSELNHNIYIDKTGFQIKPEYNELHKPQQAKEFQNVLEGIFNLKVPNPQKEELINNLFETIPHPIIGNTTLGEYNQIMNHSQETRNILLGLNETVPNAPKTIYNVVGAFDASSEADIALNRASSEIDRARLRISKILNSTDTEEISADVFKPKAVGQDITIKAIEAITFGDKNAATFLNRVALVESDFGTDKNTFKQKDSSGIFQIERGGAYAEVIRRLDPEADVGGSVRRYNDQLKDAYGIDLSQMSYEDLEQPIIGAAFARAYLLTVPEPIPVSKREQSEYWKKYYNTALGKGTPERFVRETTFKGI